MVYGWVDGFGADWAPFESAGQGPVGRFKVGGPGEGAAAGMYPRAAEAGAAAAWGVKHAIMSQTSPLHRPSCPGKANRDGTCSRA